MTIKIVWVGGPEGRGFLPIQAKLERLGVEVAALWQRPGEAKNKTTVPDGVRAVLVNRAMSDDGDVAAARLLCEEHGVPFQMTSSEVPRIVQAMHRAGIPLHIQTPGHAGIEPTTPLDEGEAIDSPPPGAPVYELGGVSLYQDGPLNDRAVYAVASMKPGERRRRLRPMLVDGTLFLSITETGLFFESSPGKLYHAVEAAGGRLEWLGMEVRWPTWEEACQLLPLAVHKPAKLPIEDPPSPKPAPKPEPPTMRHILPLHFTPAPATPPAAPPAPAPRPLLPVITKAPDPTPRPAPLPVLFTLYHFSGGLVVLEPAHTKAIAYRDIADIPDELRPFIQEFKP